MSKPRVECPLDPKHSVFVHRLKNHLKICNSRPKEKPVYYTQGVNVDNCSQKYTGKRELASFTPVEVQEIIRKLRICQEAHLLDSEESILHHDALSNELGSEVNGLSARKHLEQISSLLGNMDKLNLFAPNSFYIEFGAGKGRLSQWIFDVVTDFDDAHFILVDRQNVRHKRDLHHKEVRKNLLMERLIIDIQDLALNKVSAIRENTDRPIVAYCKHLCGAATDLSLRSLFLKQADLHKDGQTSHPPTLNVKGIAMATCCHHRCSWDSYVGKDYLAMHGFIRSEFEALIRLSSWNVCGSRSGHEENKMADQTHSDDNIRKEEKETLTSALDLTIPEREEIGRMCKRLIDAGRMHFLQQNGMMGKLVQYVNPGITLENIMILAHDQLPRS